MKKNRIIGHVSLIAGLMALGLASAPAANVFKADDANNLNDPLSWVGSVAPGSGDVATWDHTVQVNTTSVLGANTSWAGVKVLDPAGALTINTNSGGNVLTLGASGFDLSQATNNLIWSSVVALGANQTWNVTNGLTLTMVNPITGSSWLALNNGGNNNGTIIMGGASSYTGGTSINSGIVQPNTITSFGTGIVTNNGGTLLLSVFPNAGVMVNGFNVTGTSVIDMNNRGISAVLDGAWSGNGTILITNLTSTGATFTFGGASGGNMANFTGSVIVQSANAASTPSAGAVRFNNGGSQVNTGNANASFDLGEGSSAVILENRDAGTTSLGELKGGPLTFVTGQTSGNGTETWSIGGRNTSTTYAGTIKNQGSSALSAVTKVGTGILTLSGNNTYTGPTIISAGALQIGDGVTSGTGTLGTGAVTDNGTLIFARPDATSVANAISGSGNVVQSAASILTLTAANTYNGATIVTNNGTIQAGVAGAIPPATGLTLGVGGTSGTLDLLGNNVQVNALNTGSGATGSTVGSSGGTPQTLFTVNATNGTSIYNGVIRDTLPLIGGSGTVALTVEGGKLTLGGANTYSGFTTISNGTLALASGGSISSTTILLQGSGAAVLDTSAAGGLSLPSGFVLAANGSVAGNVTAANSLITPGTNGTVGSLTFSNNLALTGGVTAYFDLSTSPSSGNDTITVIGALNLSGLNTIQYNPLIGSLVPGTYKLFKCGSVSGTVANLQLVGTPGSGLAAALSVTGTEVDLVVSATAAPLVWHGDSSLNQWDYSTANWRSNSNASLFTDGSFTVFDNTGSTTPAVDITAPVSPATVTVNASVNYTFGSVGGSGKITGIGSLTKTNTGTLVLLTPNDFAGGVNINQGTIQVGNGSVSGSALGNGGVNDNASLVFNQPDPYDFTNVISGIGSLTQQGTATLTLSGNNTYSGPTVISSGTLQVGDGGVSSMGGSLGTNTVTDNAALAFDVPVTVTQSGLITGSGTLTQQSSATLIVTASNNFTGGTLISAGTLQLGNGGTTGSVLTNIITDNGTLAFDHSMNETYSAVINGAGGISKLGTNTLTLTGGNTYNGNTSIPGGTLKVGVAGTIPTGSGFGNIVLNAGSSAAGTLDMNGLNLTVNGITGSSNSVLGQIVNNAGTAVNVLTIGNGDASTSYSGTIEDNNNGTGGKIALVKTGAGTITLGNTNSYTGGTVISNGVLATANATANNTAGFSAFGPTNNPIVFDGGGITLYNSASDNTTVYTFYNPLIVSNGQTGTLTMFERGDLYSTLTGGGTLNTVDPGSRGTLAGNWSAFTGTINIQSGQFRINNSFGYSNAIININDGADLDTGADGNPGASGQTVDIGELDGTAAATIGAGGKPSSTQTWRVGWLNTVSTFAGTIVNGTSSGSTGDALVKVGTGKLILTGINTYVNSTTVSNGVLALAFNGSSDGSIDDSSSINIFPGAAIDVSGRSDGTFQVGASTSQLLEGRGTVIGSLNVGGSGVVSPGGGLGGNTGTITVTNAITLGGTAWMKLNRGNVTNSDRLISSLSTITYGNTLVVTNIGAALQVGDTFTLFSGGGLGAGTFSTIVLPLGYKWDTSMLAVSGSIKVTALAKFGLAGVDFSGLSGGSITLNATNGTPNAPVNILTSTNLALPVSTWTTNASTTLDGNGSLNGFVITVDPTLPQLFILLQM